MHRLLILTSIFLLSFTFQPTPSYAQGGVSWFTHQDAGANECYFDIYANHDSSYIAVGSSGNGNECHGEWFMTKIDRNGETIWSRTDDNNRSRSSARSVIEADNGDFVVVGHNRFNGNVDVMRIDDNGNQIWRNLYMQGQANAVIELKSGSFLVCGKAGRQGFLLLLNGEGRELWSRTYAISDHEYAMGFFNSMRETDNQVVVAGEGYRWVQPQPLQYDAYHIWLVKVDLDEDGDVIWETQQELGRMATCNTLLSCDGGYVVSGMTDVTGTFSAYIMNFNSVGEEQNTHIYEHQNETEYGWCLAKDQDGKLAIAGRSRNSGSLYSRPMMIFTNAEGVEQDHSYHDFADMHGFEPNYPEFRTTVVGLDNSVLAAGNVYTSESGYDGLIMKWEPQHDPPQLISWTPEDTLLNVLQGDTIDFAALTEDLNGMIIGFLWTYSAGIGVDTISTDNHVQVIFNDMGSYTVQCQVTNGFGFDTVTWHITSTGMYIEYWSPENLDISILRNEDVDFFVSLRHIDTNERPQIQWFLDGEDIDEDDEINLFFDHRGQYRLTAHAQVEQFTDSITWNITVNSAILDWSPANFNVIADIDSSLLFVMNPTNPESEELSILWTVDGEVLYDTPRIWLDFESIGNHEVMVYVEDGQDIDSLAWHVTITETNSIEVAGDVPAQFHLAEPHPNPFNESVRFGYTLPTASNVQLSIYNINGRLIEQIVNGRADSGTHSVVWHAQGLPAGMYFIRMEADNFVQIRKIMMLK